ASPYTTTRPPPTQGSTAARPMGFPLFGPRKQEIRPRREGPSRRSEELIGPVRGGTALLVLSRRVGEVIVINSAIRVTVVSVRGDRVRLGVAAPASVCVDRLEVRGRRLDLTGPALPPLNPKETVSCKPLSLVIASGSITSNASKTGLLPRPVAVRRSS